MQKQWYQWTRLDKSHISAGSVSMAGTNTSTCETEILSRGHDSTEWISASEIYKTHVHIILSYGPILTCVMLVKNICMKVACLVPCIRVAIIGLAITNVRLAAIVMGSSHGKKSGWLPRNFVPVSLGRIGELNCWTHRPLHKLIMTTQWLLDDWWVYFTKPRCEHLMST